MEFLIATNNQHKLKEYGEILAPFGITVRSLKDEGIVCNPEEDGKTFEDNSLIKAKECAKKTDKIILADDSGLIVDALPDILGVQTSRFLGEETPYPYKRLELIKRLKGKDRSARFVCVITILNLEDKPLVFKGECLGQIALESKGEEGFGYDPVFIPNGYQETFASLGEETKNKISHRALAATKLTAYLKEKLDEDSTN